MADPPVYWDASTKRYHIGKAPHRVKRKLEVANVQPEEPSPISPGGGLTYDRASGQYRLNGFRVTL